MQATPKTMPTYTQRYQGYVLQNVGKGISSRCHVYRNGQHIATCLDTRQAKAYVLSLVKG